MREKSIKKREKTSFPIEKCKIKLTKNLNFSILKESQILTGFQIIVRKS